jgi:hypothetical protein
MRLTCDRPNGTEANQAEYYFDGERKQNEAGDGTNGSDCDFEYNWVGQV